MRTTTQPEGDGGTELRGGTLALKGDRRKGRIKLSVLGAGYRQKIKCGLGSWCVCRDKSVPNDYTKKTSQN